MDGLVLIRAVLAINPTARIIALSGSPNGEYQTKALEAGAKKHLLKPCAVEALLTSLDELLRNHSEGRTNFGK